MRLSMLTSSSTSRARATEATSSIRPRISSRPAAVANICEMVARVSALTGFSVALPRSLTQISARRRVDTGALKPAAPSMVAISCARSLFDPSGSPTENRLPSSCSMTPGSTSADAT